MTKAPSLERFNEIKAEYENRRRSRSGKERLWAVIGELVAIIEALADGDAMRERHPLVAVNGENYIAIPPQPEWKGSTEPGAITYVGAHEIRERAFESRLQQEAPAPSPAPELTPQQRAVKFATDQRARDAALTPEARDKILADEAAADALQQQNFQAWKGQFDPATPYVPPSA